MAAKKKPEEKIQVEDQYTSFLLRLETDMYNRIKLQALKRFGIASTAYIKMAIIKQLEDDESSENVLRKKLLRQ